nr:MAG TPA: hypothetical protein [Caudoviricetes sp.]
MTGRGWAAGFWHSDPPRTPRACLSFFSPAPKPGGRYIKSNH